MVTITKKTKPPVKPTPADSTRAVQIKRRNTAINETLGVVKVYREQHPGKDPAKLAAAGVYPKDKNGQPIRTREVENQMKQVRDTTMVTSLQQAMRERSSSEAGLPIRLNRKSGKQQ